MSTDREIKLEKIAKEIADCKNCQRNKSGLPVPGEGSVAAKIVFIGEAPGKDEAKTGRPFVGRAGKILRELIADAGLNENEVFITSPVKYLPDYATPTLEDIIHGRGHLCEQLDVIKPKIIVLLGRVAAYALLERNVEISKLHGTVQEKDGVKYFFSYHPAAPLHNPNLKGELLEDFRKLKKLLNGQLSS